MPRLVVERARFADLANVLQVLVRLSGQDERSVLTVERRDKLQKFIQVTGLQADRRQELQAQDFVVGPVEAHQQHRHGQPVPGQIAVGLRFPRLTGCR